MKEITLNKGLVAIVDDDDFVWLRELRWHARKVRHNWYARSTIRINPQENIHVFMHRAVMQTPKGMQTDHINRNTLDNRKQNLRICTRQQNSFNRPCQSNNTSGYKGVYLSKKSNKWVAQIKINGRMRSIGCFLDIKDAVSAYNEQAVKIFREFAFLNKVDTDGV